MCDTVKKGYIYMTTCLVNGKKYIGKQRIHRRKERRYLGSGKLLCRAIKKYGIKNFSKEILVEGQFTNSQLEQLEAHYIQFHGAHLNSEYYNILPGGAIYNSYKKPYKYLNIYHYNKDGVVLGIYQNTSHAIEELGISEDTILRCLRLGTYSRKHDSYFTTSRSDVRKRKGSRKKRVYIYSQEGEPIGTFDSVTKAANYLGTSTSAIKNCQTIKGHVVSYKPLKKEECSEILTLMKSKKGNWKIIGIGKLDSNSNLIEVWEESIKGLADRLNYNYKSFYSALKNNRNYKGLKYKILWD